MEGCGHLKIAKGNCSRQIKAFHTANWFAQMPLGDSQNCCLFRPHSVIRHATVSGLHGDEATSAMQLLSSSVRKNTEHNLQQEGSCLG